MLQVDWWWSGVRSDWYLEFNKFVAGAFCSVALVGCGGGGAGAPAPTSPSPPPPPPPTSNNAPNIVVELSASQVFEQNQFVISVEQSTDSEGDSFSITMTQIAGPTAARLQDVNSLATRWRAPSVDQNAIVDVEFEIRAEDNRGATALTNVSVPVRGFSGPGRPVATFSPAVSLISGNVGVPGELNSGLLDVIGLQDNIGGATNNPRRLVFFGEDTGLGYFDYLRSDQATLDETFSNVSFLRKGALGFNFQGFPTGTGELIVTNELDDEVVWITTQSSDASDRPFARQDSFGVDNPCFFLGRNNTGQDFVWVGQRDQGVSVIRLSPQDDGTGRTVFDASLVSQASQGRSLCHFVTTSFPQRLYQPDPQNNSNFDNLLAVDYNSNELVLLGDTDEDQRYEELEVSPIDTQSSVQLSIVDVFSRGNAVLVPRVLAILMTDGLDGGENRLIVVTQDQNDELVQTVFSWRGGVPVSLLEGSFVGVRPGDQTRRDLVVVSSDGQSLVFENTVPENAGVATPPTYAAPIMFDTGAGAGTAVTARDDNFSDNVVMVSYPAAGEVRVFRPSDLIP